METDLNALALACVPAMGAAWVTYRFGRRRERHAAELDRRGSAAEDLAGPLRELRGLLRRYGRVAVDDTEVTEAFAAWFAAHDCQRTRLPDGWGHLGRSVRIAAGTVFGAPSWVDLRPDVAGLPLAEPDGLWQDLADDYIDYVLDVLVRWGDDSRDSVLLLDYDAWLVRTGRRNPVGSNGPT